MSNTEKKILETLELKTFFTKHDVQDLLISYGGFVSDSALNIKIFRWRQKGLIHDLAKGKYVINNKINFQFPQDETIDKIQKLFISKYRDLNYCIWSSAWLASYMNHVPMQFFYILETEKEQCESVFYFLKDHGFNVFYEVDSKQIEKYVLSAANSIIIQPLITRSPIDYHNGINYASIEKILVDIFCDDETFYLYSGVEQKWIFENILRTLNINFSTLLNYAERRKKNKQLKDFLTKHFNNQLNGLI